MKNFCNLIILMNIYTALSCSSMTQSLSRQDMLSIGNKIWHNEMACSVDKLTWWNEGERFASLGIGHFIWFPTNHAESFTELFPLLLVFLRDHGTKLPTWLASTPPCPWESRESFFADKKTERMQSLQELLKNTIELQTQFIIQQLNNDLPALTKNLSRPARTHLENNLKQLAKTPQGMYALIDYRHFKGSGTNTRERYKGQGWGLVQVLENMQSDTKRLISPVQQFVQSARELLSLRVKNSPPERNEQKWLPGWHNRVESYLES